MCLQRFTPRIVVTVLLIAGTAVSGCPSANSGDGPDRVVSLINLIVTPEKYEGIAIRVSGFLSSTGSLCLTREYAAMLDVGAVHVLDQTPGAFLRNHCVDSYAMVEGTFRRSRELKGPPSEVTDYVLSDVTRVLLLKDGVLESCWPPKER